MNRLKIWNPVKLMDLRRARAFVRAVSIALPALALGGVLLWSAPAQAQTVTVLIKNTGETSASFDGLGAVHGSLTKGAQAFTTGANPADYTLSSIGFSFNSITSTSTAGAHLVVTLNGVDSSGNPDAALCTLTDPGTFSGAGVQTFDAPAADPCPTLTANTTYFAVVERVATAESATISLGLATSDNEDTGGATGWSIGNDRHRFTTAWSSPSTSSFAVEIRGYANNNPATGAPSISGVLEEDEVLTADTAGIADIDVLGTFSYQWLADGTAISGATSATYTLTASEVGDAISLTVTFTDGEGNSESLTSAATHNVVADGATRKLLWVGTLTPADVGTGEIGFGDTTVGSLSPSSFIDGSTTYTFEAIEFGTAFGLAIVVKPVPGAVEQVKWIFDAGGEFALFDATLIERPENLRSEWRPTQGNPGWSIGTETVVYLLEDLNNRATGAPSISGVLQQDEELTADTAGIADADGVGTLSYKWLADGTAISGATSATYTLTASEVGDAISLTVTFTDVEGYSESLTSAETHSVVATGATRKLLWVGTLTPGDRGGGALGFNRFSAGSLNPFSFTYGSDTYTINQLEFGPIPSIGLLFVIEQIPGANEEEAWIFDTGREFALADASIGRTGTLIGSWPASYGDPNWSIGEETVVYLLEVFNYPATGAPSISGTPRVGEELTADTSGISDDDGPDSPSYAYQWVSVDGMTEANIGSDSTTYTLKDSDADKRIRVDVTFTDDRSNSEGPLSSELTDTVAPTDLLVRNTTEHAVVKHALISNEPKRAQAFTTDSYIAGYQLDSVGFLFANIANTSTAGSQLVVTLNSEDSGSPGDALCTLTDPATFSTSGLHTFKAPTSASDLCPTLTPSTTYFAVVERVTFTADEIALLKTESSAEHAGSAPDWSIGNDRHYYSSTSSAWTTVQSEAHLIEVKGEERDQITVPVEWALTPSGLTTGDKFRLMFRTGTGSRSSNSSDIEVYNMYVQGQANASNAHADIKAYHSWFRVLGSTADVDARDNTQTTSSDTNAAIYWLNGAKVADNYGDLYDGSWDSEAAADRAGSSSSAERTFWTGTTNSGQEAFSGSNSRALGQSLVSVGRLNGAGSPLSANQTGTPDASFSYYALSGIFVVPVTNAAPEFSAETATRTLLENSGAGVDVVGGVITATDSDSGDTLTYSLTGTDAGSFEIDSSSGQISTKTGVTHSFDFESATKSYSVTVEVSDSKDAAGDADTVIDDTIAVTINLTNVDEDGTVTLPATFSGGVEATASVTDLDGTVSGASWRWARGNTATGSFSNISGATSAGYTPVAADVLKYLRATVTYTDPEGSGKTASAVSSSAVGASNAEPAFSADSATRTLPENSGAGVDVVGGVITATDGDSDTLTYSLSGTDAARFEIDSSSGQIKVKTGSTHTFNFEATKNSYSVTVNVRDSKDAAGNADTATDDTIAVTIDLTNVNEAPTITNLLDTPNVPENSSGTILLMASDVDVPDTQTWSVESTDDGSKFQVASGFLPSLSFKDQPDFETPTDVGMNNTYVVTVKLTDSGGLSDTLTFTVTVTNVNEAPEITTNSGEAHILSEAENTATSEVIETFQADDVDASTTLTWSLQGADAGDFTITTNADGEGELKFRNVPDFENPAGSIDGNIYVLVVRVRDNHTPRKEDTIGVNVHVTDVNEAPVITTTATTFYLPENGAIANSVHAMDVDASTTLTWSVESDDDGDKFEFNTTTGPSALLTFKTAPDFETPTDVGDTAMNNTYVVTVKVTDDGSPAMSDTHRLTVEVTNVNEAPEITTTSTTYTDFDVDENTATSDVIKTYEASDVDASTTLTWSLEGNDAGDFTITKNADGHGELKFRNAPNFEMPVDADTMNDYDIRVKVRDNGIPGNRGSSNRLDDTVSVEVNVLDVNEAPVISGAAHPSFAEIEYDATSPVLTVATYTYTDEDTNPADTITWRLGNAFDAPHFDIGSSTGVLSFNMRPDFENPFGADNEYLIVVEADDGQGGVGDFDVVVTVTNVDETPEITTTAASHTAPSFVEIEYDAATADLVVADYDGRDEEGQTISWSRTGTDAGDFSIDSSTGVLSFAQRPNYEMPADNGGDNVYNITVRARDTASPVNTRELEVVVTVTDVNERPDIDEDTVPSYAEIQYDSTGTRPDVHTFTAEDYDAGDTFAWSLLGTDAAYLEIGAASGVLTFAQDSGFGQGPLPNFEHPRDDDVGDGSSNTYSITVRATDDDASNQKFTDYAVVVTVTDVNEAPEFTGTPDTAITLDEHDANDNYVVMDLEDYDARDEEGVVTWSLTGTDRRDFAVSADGVVTFVKTPNFEAPEDSGGDNVYEFRVVATDVQSGSSRRNVGSDVTVTVGDVEEDGTLAVENLNPAAGETVTFRLTDPDGGIVTTSTADITWVIQSLVSGGSWARVSGVLTPASTTFPWVVDEDETGKAIRAMVTYTDRRGSGKTAVSQQTAEVTANPIANAPPRFRGVSSWSVEEGPAGGPSVPPLPRLTATTTP